MTLNHQLMLTIELKLKIFMYIYSIHFFYINKFYILFKNKNTDTPYVYPFLVNFNTLIKDDIIYTVRSKEMVQQDFQSKNVIELF